MPRDNAPPPDGWTCEPRCCPFKDCGICETDQHAVWVHGTDEHITRGDN